jgi:hypothetical protein
VDDRQYAAYQAYVRELAKALLLADWEIELDRNRSSEGTLAQISVMDTENHAVVYVAWPEFFHAKPEEQREWLTHELLHCHIDRPQRVLTTFVEECQHSDALALMTKLHMNEIEICVQRFARLLAPSLPLPNFGDESEAPQPCMRCGEMLAGDCPRCDCPMRPEAEANTCAFCGRGLAEIVGWGFACQTRGCPLEAPRPKAEPCRCPCCTAVAGAICPTWGEDAIEGGCLYPGCPLRGS